MSEGSSRMRLGTEEDLERVFGSERLLIGFPVEQDDDEAEEADDDGTPGISRR